MLCTFSSYTLIVSLDKLILYFVLYLHDQQWINQQNPWTITRVPYLSPHHKWLRNASPSLRDTERLAVAQLRKPEVCENLFGEIQIGKHSQRIHKRERDLSKHKQKLDELLLEKNNKWGKGGGSRSKDSQNRMCTWYIQHTNKGKHMWCWRISETRDNIYMRW